MTFEQQQHGVVVDGGLLLQPLWDRLRGGGQGGEEGEMILGSPYLPAVYAFLTHLLLCAPFLVLDGLGRVSPWISSYSIAAGRSTDPHWLRRWLDCLVRILSNYCTTVLPVTACFQSLRSPKVPEQAPSCWQLLVEVVGCLLLFDMLFFVWHYSMHRVPWLYKNVHQTHHQNHTPFALAAQDASSAELLSLLLLALTCAWIVGCHPLSEALFHLLNSWLAVEDHCGYDLPWGLHRLLPCLGGAPFHQAHHSQLRGNYAPYFTHLDLLCGTFIYSSNRRRLGKEVKGGRR